MKGKILVIALAGLLSCAVSARAQGVRVCSCVDKADLLGLLNEAEMGIQESESQFKAIQKLEAATAAAAAAAGKPVMATPEWLKSLSESMKSARTSVALKSYPPAAADELNYDNCTVREAGGATDCVRLVRKRFTDHMQKKCLEAQVASGGGSKPFFEALEARAYLVQIMKAYYEMRDFILAALGSLPKSCRPNNWFGYVVYQKVKSTVTVRNIPPQNTKYNRPGAGANIINGGSETTGARETYTGSVLVEEGKASGAKGSATLNMDRNKTFSGRIYCSPNRPDESFVATSGTKLSAHGESNGTPDFHLNFSPGERKYHLYLAFPFPVEVSGPSSVFGNTSGGCGADPTNQSGVFRSRVIGESYGVDGALKPESPDYLEGTKTETPPLLNQSTQAGHTSGTNTYEIQLRWMLRRLPAK